METKKQTTQLGNTFWRFSKALIITLTKLQHWTVFDLRDPRLTIRNTADYLGRRVVLPIQPQSGGPPLVGLLPPLIEHIPDCPLYIKVAFLTRKTRKHLAVVIINWPTSCLFTFINFLFPYWIPDIYVLYSDWARLWMTEESWSNSCRPGDFPLLHSSPILCYLYRVFWYNHMM
jgi:hypothetical protein